jgi:hypothetical protein
MTLALIIKSVIVILFLAMFLRRPRVLWGIGLLTVTTAILLDTFLGTFGREEMLAELGFFFFIISGALFSGAAAWAWGLLRPLTMTRSAGTIFTELDTRPAMDNAETLDDQSMLPDIESSTAVDRQMLFDEIRNRLGREDVIDLIFDLSINENDVMTVNQDMNQLIINTMDLVAQRGQDGDLALAVERILTPIPPERLPRLERISPDSPPTILRHFLLAHYELSRLQQIANDLDIDWEEIGVGGKKEKVRNLLLYLYRRNRVDELIAVIQEGGDVTTGVSAADG